ncbi:MAG: HRDC domain-containing protein [Myxococcota bacterium]
MTANRPTGGADGKAPILASAADASRLDQILRGARRIAVDTEFHAERRYVPELYLVQIHVDGGDTWIVDPLRDDLIVRIAPALKAVPWVVHAGEQDLRVLSVALGGLPDTVLDTQIAAGLVSSHWPAPYQGLVSQYLGRPLDKGETLSDWSRRPLSAAQLSYAALDVELVLPLWDRLEQLLADRGRRETGLAACEHARRAAIDPPTDAEAFREIPAAPTLAPNALLVLQELAAWRLERARATNQPVRAVLSDGALVDLARRQPITVESLTANRRLPRTIHRDAPELVERIARASRRPEFAVPKLVRKRTPGWRRAAWLQLWAECAGERSAFGAGLVLPRILCELLVLDPPADRDALRAALGWRDAVVGDELLDVLAGRATLRLGPVDVDGSPPT